MPRYRIIETRAESAQEEALDKWFGAQSLASPDALQDAAKLIIGLITGLLTVLFGVLAVAQKDIPGYLNLPEVRWLGAAAVALFAVSLAAGLVVVLPFRVSHKPGQPETQRLAFASILQRKSTALTVTAIAFGAGIIALAAALIIAMLRM